VPRRARTPERARDPDLPRLAHRMGARRFRRWENDNIILAVTKKRLDEDSSTLTEQVPFFQRGSRFSEQAWLLAHAEESERTPPPSPPRRAAQPPQRRVGALAAEMFAKLSKAERALLRAKAGSAELDDAEQRLRAFLRLLAKDAPADSSASAAVRPSAAGRRGSGDSANTFEWLDGSSEEETVEAEGWQLIGGRRNADADADADADAHRRAVAFDSSVVPPRPRAKAATRRRAGRSPGRHVAPPRPLTAAHSRRAADGAPPPPRTLSLPPTPSPQVRAVQRATARFYSLRAGGSTAAREGEPMRFVVVSAAERAATEAGRAAAQTAATVSLRDTLRASSRRSLVLD
jgi:hypothetical protein